MGFASWGKNQSYRTVRQGHDGVKGGARENQENGRKLHQQHLDANEKRNHQRLERILEGYTDADGNHVDGLKDTWKGTGYNSKEMEMLEEAWLKLN